MTHRGTWLALALFATVLVRPCARANEAAGPTAGAALRAIAGFLAPGGYFLTGRRARDAFGGSKWAGEMSLHGRAKRAGVFVVSGGFDRLGVSDRYLPFSGGNEFTLTGAGIRITTAEQTGRVRPTLTAGLYAGHVRCDALNLATTQLVPSASLGAEWRVCKNVSLSASYRVSTPIGGLSLDGFGVFLKLF